MTYQFPPEAIDAYARLRAKADTIQAATNYRPTAYALPRTLVPEIPVEEFHLMGVPVILSTDMLAVVYEVER